MKIAGIKSLFFLGIGSVPLVQSLAAQEARPPFTAVQRGADYNIGLVSRIYG